jgi:hypothetical protein
LKRILLFSLLIVHFSLPIAFAADYGMVINGEAEAVGADETDASGTVILAPWISVPFSKGQFYFSPGLYVGFEPERSSAETIIAPELLRLEFSYKPSSLFSFRVGRFNWQDPSHLTAKGRFDGADLLFNVGTIRLGVSALYTGFLFKETAEINASPTDTTDYTAIFDWGNFADTYFAPRRLMAALYGEFPGFPSNRGHLYAGLLAQFDLSEADERFHTQYLLLRHTLVFGAFDIAVAGALQLENTKAEGVRPAFAATLEGGWQLPTAITDRLSLGLSYASGDASGTNPGTAAFFPIVREAQSFVLEPCLSGIMFITANYHARLLPSLSADLTGRYFIRTDSTSFISPYLKDDSYPLGAELDAGLLWVPLSDLSFSLKGGVFLPKTGTAWADNAPVLWRITLATIFSF